MSMLMTRMHNSVRWILQEKMDSEHFHWVNEKKTANSKAFWDFRWGMFQSRKDSFSHTYCYQVFGAVRDHTWRRGVKHFMRNFLEKHTIEEIRAGPDDVNSLDTKIWTMTSLKTRKEKWTTWLIVFADFCKSECWVFDWGELHVLT